MSKVTKKHVGLRVALDWNSGHRPRGPLVGRVVGFMPTIPGVDSVRFVTILGNDGNRRHVQQALWRVVEVLPA